MLHSELLCIIYVAWLCGVVDLLCVWVKWVCLFICSSNTFWLFLHNNTAFRCYITASTAHLLAIQGFHLLYSSVHIYKSCLKYYWTRLIVHQTTIGGITDLTSILWHLSLDTHGADCRIIVTMVGDDELYLLSPKIHTKLVSVDWMRYFKIDCKILP